MLSWDLDPAPPGFKGSWFLWKLLIDHRHQGKGYGREVVRQIVEIVRAEGGTELLDEPCRRGGADRPASTRGSASSPPVRWIRTARSSFA